MYLLMGPYVPAYLRCGPLPRPASLQGDHGSVGLWHVTYPPPIMQGDHGSVGLDLFLQHLGQCKQAALDHAQAALKPNPIPIPIPIPVHAPCLKPNSRVQVAVWPSKSLWMPPLPLLFDLDGSRCISCCS